MFWFLFWFSVLLVCWFEKTIQFPSGNTPDAAADIRASAMAVRGCRLWAWPPL